jgi:membrane-associated phospholipid phosphatase
MKGRETMRRNFTWVHSLWRSATMLAVLLLAVHCSSAQTAAPTPSASPQPTPQAKPSPSLERRFVINILHDQRAIWTSPFHIHGGDARYLAPIGLGTAALIATDRYTAGEVDNSGSLPPLSRNISRLGAVYTTGGVAAAFYLIGRARGNARARETGLLGAEALIDSGIVVQALKTITQRPRPLVDDASGEFFDRGNSFPSGHAISAWSLATVIAQEYGHHRPLVRYSAYGLATAVSLSRYTSRTHFLSDVLVGSAFGYGIGRYVYLKHHDTNLDLYNGEHSSVLKSKLFPLIAPRLSRGQRGAREYGVTLAWSF